MFCPLQNPTTVLVTGPTQSGKSFWTKRLLEEKDRVFENPPVRVVYAYGAWQPAFEELRERGVLFHEGLPGEEDIDRWFDGSPSLLVLDDVMKEACDSPEITRLFTVKCHHGNISVVFLTQNIFPPGKCSRTISLNCHYIVLFKTKRDQLQVQTLGRQLLPGQSGYFMESYADATASRHGYLLCDLHPRTEKEFMLRSRIFPGEYHWYYTPKSDDAVPKTRVLDTASTNGE